MINGFDLVGQRIYLGYANAVKSVKLEGVADAVGLQV